MRIRDWSSDVCCSDLPPGRLTCAERQGRPRDGDNRGIAPQERAPRRGNAMQWTADKVQEEVVKLLHPFNPQEIEITPDTDLSADLMLDSVARSEERRGGKACVRTCRSRWSTYH